MAEMLNREARAYVDEVEHHEFDGRIPMETAERVYRAKVCELAARYMREQSQPITDSGMRWGVRKPCAKASRRQWTQARKPTTRTERTGGRGRSHELPHPRRTTERRTGPATRHAGLCAVHARCAVRGGWLAHGTPKALVLPGLCRNLPPRIRDWQHRNRTCRGISLAQPCRMPDDWRLSAPCTGFG